MGGDLLRRGVPVERITDAASATATRRRVASLLVLPDGQVHRQRLCKRRRYRMMLGPELKERASEAFSSLVRTRYDTRCYFNGQSKADMSKLDLPHGTNS